METSANTIFSNALQHQDGLQIQEVKYYKYKNEGRCNVKTFRKRYHILSLFQRRRSLFINYDLVREVYNILQAQGRFYANKISNKKLVLASPQLTQLILSTNICKKKQ